MKNSKRKKIQRMMMEDDLGIRRGRRNRRVISVKAYQIIRLCLIISVPVVYFLFSPLLILVAVLWAGLLLVTNSIEKSYNYGLKKDLQVRLPKTDSILCLLLIIITIIGVCVSAFSGSSRASIFEGMTDSELADKIGHLNLSSVNNSWNKIVSKLKDFGSLLTGTRYLFQTQRGFGGMGFGGIGGNIPSGVTPPSGSKPDIGQLLQNLPFSMIFQSILQAVDTALLVIICIVGLFSIRKVKKLNIDNRTLGERERAKLLKKEREKQEKANAKKNLFRVEKADFSELEKQTLADLEFLFEIDFSDDTEAEITDGGQDEKSK